MIDTGFYVTAPDEVIDMNCSPPEVAAMKYLRDPMVPGALVVLDDDAYNGYREQKLGIDPLRRAWGCRCCRCRRDRG